MTLPVSGPISLSQIANEVGLSLPISINHPWLLTLTNKAGLPVSFSDFYGKTGRYDGSLICQSEGSSQVIEFGSSPWFGGQLSNLAAVQNIFTGQYSLILGCASPPNWSGHLLVRKNTSEVSIILPKMDSVDWGLQGSSPVTPANLLRIGNTHSFTIVPSN
jgi:hypothetical protein